MQTGKAQVKRYSKNNKEKPENNGKKTNNVWLINHWERLVAIILYDLHACTASHLQIQSVISQIEVEGIMAKHKWYFTISCLYSEYYK